MARWFLGGELVGGETPWWRDDRIPTVDQFRYIKIQSKTIDLSKRLWEITTEFVGFLP